MSLQSHFEFLFIGKDEGSFLENYSYDLTEEHGARGGKLFITLEIQNNPTDAEIIGETLADTIRRLFFADLDLDPYTRLEEALKGANNVIERFKEQRVSKFIGTIHMVVGAICENELYLTQTGDAEAYLVRKNFISVISEGLAGDANDEGEVFTNIASGSLEKQDFVIFSTTRLLRYISQTEFTKCLKPSNLNQSLDKLKDHLSTEILSKIAVIGIVIGKQEEETPAPVTPPQDVEVHEEIQRSGGSAHRRDQISTVTKNFLNRATNLLRGASPKEAKTQKDKILIGLIVIILILTGGIWFSKNQKDRSEEILRLDEVIQDANRLVSEAETKGQFNKTLANELLIQANEKAIEVRNSGLHRNKANEVLSRIEKTKVNVDNIEIIDTPKIIADLSSKRPNVSALGIVGTEDLIYVYEYNALYEIIANQLKDPKTIDDNETVIAATDFNDRDSVIFITKNGKVIEYRDDRFQFSDSQEGSFRKGVSVADWSNKIYILDPDGKQVWRYPYSGRSEIFNKPDQYLNDGDITGAIDIAIDKYVYVLKENGEILQYFGGDLQEFPLKKLPLDPIEKPTKLYTDAELNEMFLLEPDKNRVLVFDKDEKNGGAVYRNQYVFENSDDLRDLYFDKTNRQLYVLSASKVYEVKF